MCHEILKEEEDDDDDVEDVEDVDDEVKSLNEVSDVKHCDDLLDEQNGNITEQLTNLTLNEDSMPDTAANLNGNDVADDSDKGKNKKTGKKPTKAGEIECDSNDNKLDEDSALVDGQLP